MHAASKLMRFEDYMVRGHLLYTGIHAIDVENKKPGYGVMHVESIGLSIYASCEIHLVL